MHPKVQCDNSIIVERNQLGIRLCVFDIRAGIFVHIFRIIGVWHSGDNLDDDSRRKREP